MFFSSKLLETSLWRLIILPSGRFYLLHERLFIVFNRRVFTFFINSGAASSFVKKGLMFWRLMELLNGVLLYAADVAFRLALPTFMDECGSGFRLLQIFWASMYAGVGILPVILQFPAASADRQLSTAATSALSFFD